MSGIQTIKSLPEAIQYFETAMAAHPERDALALLGIGKPAVPGKASERIFSDDE